MTTPPLEADSSSRSATAASASVVVLADTTVPLRPTLDSLLSQDVAPERLEIVVVVDDADRDSLRAVDLVRSGSVGHTVRLVRASIQTKGQARNLGIDAARHPYLTFVDAPDTVTPEFIRYLLYRADGYTVAVARVATFSHGHHALSRADESYLRFASRKTSIVDAPMLADDLGGKLLPSHVARTVRFDETLATDEWVIFWSRVLVRGRMRASVLRLDSPAAYLRVERDLSASYEIEVASRLRVLTDLERWAGDRVRRQGVLAALSQARSQTIGRFLRSHPEHQARALDDVRRASLSSFSHSAMNSELSREVVISYAFPPVNDTSGLVVARRIQAKGEPVDVISSEMAPIRKLDKTSTLIAGELVGRHHVVPGPPTFAGWSRIDAFCRNGLAFIERVQASRGPYESIYSRSMWPAAHFLAALHVVRNPGVVWRAEFSDPLQYASDGSQRLTQIPNNELIDELTGALAERGLPVPESDNTFVWIEHLVYALASTIVFTNPNQVEYMLGHLVDPSMEASIRERACIDPHPVPAPEMYQLVRSQYPLAADRVHIGYFGVFYKVRGVGDMLDALETLEATDRGRIRLHLFTDRPARTQRLVDERGLADCVVTRPYVPYLEFLNLATRFDWLLVCDARAAEVHGINPYLPSKLSDYRGSGAKIWAMIEDGSVLSTTKVDARSTLGDGTGAREVLESILRSTKT